MKMEFYGKLWKRRREIAAEMQRAFEDVQRYFSIMHGEKIEDSKWNMILIYLAKMDERIRLLERKTRDIS